MPEHLEDWEVQQEAKRAAAHKEGPLAFLAGGGTTASRREHEERCMSEALTHKALERKMLFETMLEALRKANFPDEIAHFRDMLLKLNLTPPEQQELRKALLAKMG